MGRASQADLVVGGRVLTASRDALRGACALRGADLVALTADLLRIDSTNPPGDTTAIAAFVLSRLARLDGIRVITHEPAPGRRNLLADFEGARGGRRIVINAHLDTFPIGARSGWTHDPLGGVQDGGRLYGRGVTDMKGGLAAGLLVFELLHAQRAELAGSVCLTLVADEESGGRLGTGWMLENEPAARGDAVLSADVGTPTVLRFGEKGYLWVRLHARGKSAHGAHPHRGINAIDRLTQAIAAVRSLERETVAPPPDVGAAIEATRATAIERLGREEVEGLTAITVNVGRIDGGSAFNLVPAKASAMLDIRLPPGIDTQTALGLLNKKLAGMEGLEIEIAERFEPTWTAPEAPIVRLATANAGAVCGAPAIATYRLGYSDSRFYRARGVPAVLCGPTPHNMGGADEYAEIAELEAIFAIQALTAHDFLAG